MEEQAIGRAGEAAGNTQNTAGNPGEAIKRDRRKGGGWKKYAGYGVTAFLVIAAAVILVFAFVQRKEFKTGFEKIKSAAGSVASSAAGTIGREVGKTLGGKVGGKYGKTLGGNIFAQLGRSIMGTFFK